MGQGSEEQMEEFPLFSLTGEQREYLTIKIFPIFDTFYFKIFFFLVSTSLVFITAITAAFIVIKMFEYLHSCVMVSMFYYYNWLITNYVMYQDYRPCMMCHRRVLPPSYSTVVRKDKEELPSYFQACNI